MKAKIQKQATIALIILLSLSTSITLFPSSSAHTPKWEIPSFPYIISSPNPVGVGQTTYISMWVDYALPAAAISNSIRKHDYTLTITAPDGKIETKHWDVIEDTTGIQFMSYTPTQVGTYTLKFDYGGQTYTWGANEPFIGTSAAYQNDTYKPGSTNMSLVVQQDPLPSPISSYPLPTEYWTRPIEAQNTDWFSISSNWLEWPYIRNRTQLYGTAPNSPHIMWTKPLDTGGVVGGNYSDIQGEGFYMGRSYNSRFANSIAMNGVLYYQLPSGNSGKGGGWMAVDIRTGEQLWFNEKIGAFVSAGPTRSDHDNPARILPDIAFGYYNDVASPNQHGVIPQGLLWSSNFETAYSSTTGKIMYNTTGVPTGAQTVDSHGAVLRYVVNSAGKWIAQWNSSRMWTYGWTQEGGSTPAFGVVLNATNELVTGTSCYDWNKTISNLGPGTWSVPSLTAGRISDVAVDSENIMLLQQGSLGTAGSWDGANVTAISLKSESLGQILWTKNYPAAPNNVTRSIQSWDPVLGVFVTYDRETGARNGWRLSNGDHLWGPNTPSEAYAYFDWFFPGFSAYGNYYYSGYGGTVYCWDLLTGNTEWTYGNGGVPGNTTFDVQQPWGLRPLMIQVIADGKIYLSSDEHSPNTPLYKNDLVRCLNVSTGEEIWTMMGWITGTGGGGQPDQTVVADGYLAYLNAYDMQIYVVGKGPSAMTVDAPKNSITLGGSLVISGTVTDIAAGTTQKEQAARFPNGVPAVSDASQGKWMEYVYMQKPRPTNTVGVPVTISVVDANGNYRDIGTTTSDADGFYSLNWKPDIEGKYTVYASFGGSESYWPSHAVSAFAVDSAPPTPSPYPVTTQPPTDMYILGSTVAIIIAIALVGLLILRKRP